MRLKVFLLPLVLALVMLSALPMKAQFKETAVADYYMRYVPLAAYVGLEYLGVSTDSPLLDRALAAGAGFIANGIIVNGLKYTVREERPDGSSKNSFPSGHTSVAFLGAELVRQEYGWGAGAGAYALAVTTAALRVYHKRHYWWDTMAGASCGILSAKLGTMMTGPVKDFFGIGFPEGASLYASPLYDPVTGAFGTALALRF